MIEDEGPWKRKKSGWERMKEDKRVLMRMKMEGKYEGKWKKDDGGEGG